MAEILETETIMMADPMLERGHSEPPPDVARGDLLPPVAATANVNTTHVAEPEDPPTTYYNEHHCGNILKILKGQQGRAEYCDTILLAGDRRIAVHSCILAANSPYLKSLVDQYTKPWPHIIEIILPTVSVEIAENLVCYMYSGDISINSKHVEELLSLTEKLLMDDVKQCCELHMMKTLDLNNWQLYRNLAYQYSFSDMQGEVIKFLAQNLMILKTTNDLMYLPSDDMTMVLSQGNATDDTDLELCKLECLLKWLSHDSLNNLVHYEKMSSCVQTELLSTVGMDKILEELRKDDITQHSVTVTLRSAVEQREQQNLALELETKMKEQEALLKAEEKQKEEAVTLKEEEDRQGEESTDIKEETPETQNNGTPGSDTEIDEGSYPDKPSENAENDEENESPVVIGDDNNRYLEDGTLVIEPQSAWPRGKRKSYKPKKIHCGTGRPRGRPRKHFPSSVAATAPATESPDVDGETPRVPRKRGRPPLNKTAPPALSTPTLKRKPKPTVIESKAEDQDLADIGEHSPEEVIDTEDTDPSWMPTIDVSVAVEEGEGEEPTIERSRVGRKRRPRASLPVSVIKEKKKRGRKPNPGDKTYYCTKCPRVFNSMGGLSHHMKGHGSDTPMLCEICGFSTRHYGSMNVHRRKHAGKVMHCPYENCDHTEVHRARLEDHISAVHHGVKRHMCSICGKSFGAKKHLQRHEGLHGKAKDIACNLCNYLTNRTDKLREHIRRHHPVVAVEMGMMKQEDLEKTTPPRPRQPKKKKLKKKESRFDMGGYSEQENSLEMEKQELEILVPVTGTAVAGPLAVSMVNPHHETIQLHTAPSVVVQMPHAQSIGPGTMNPTAITHTSHMGVSTIPSHLLGTTTLSEEMIQYLATYSTDPLQMHPTQVQAVPVAQAVMEQPQQPATAGPHPHHSQHPSWSGTF